MIHTVRLELADALARLAWTIAPRTGISSTYDLPSVALRRRTRTHIQWTTDLRTTIRSFLFNGPHVELVVSADTVFCRFCAVCQRVVTKLWQSTTELSQRLRSQHPLRSPSTR